MARSRRPQSSQSLSSRSRAAKAIYQVIDQGRSLPDALSRILAEPAGDGGSIAVEDQAFVRHLAYDTLRWRFTLEFLAGRLLRRPLKGKSRQVHSLLLLGLLELWQHPQRAHATVNECVEACRQLNQSWAAGLMNGSLRNFQRQREDHLAALQDSDARHAHPPWLLQHLRQDWPDDWRAITSANNQPPPLWLRVNRRQSDRAACQTTLAAADIVSHPSPHAADALRLAEARPVQQIPGFSAGRVSLQDAAAQLAGEVLGGEPGETVLDACAAPGGKACHILERSDVQLTALDIDARRNDLVRDNLARLDLDCRIITADAARPDDWWDGQPFDRILLDAPCSATGVIRRHPDIKSLRRAADIAELVNLQSALLDAIWPLLKPGGILIYATCSVLRRENEQQIARFLQRQSAAVAVAIAAEWGRVSGAGRQILPGEDEMDGFFYAQLRKQPA